MLLADTNTFTGPTTVSGGVLRLGTTGALPGGTNVTGGSSNLVLDGGIVELAAGNFSRGIGTASSQVQWSSNGGGFSASGGSRTVNLGGTSAQVTWGSGSFIPSGSPLILGSPSDDSTVYFQNPINLGSSTQQINVYNGSAKVDAVLSGNITGSGGLYISGDGVLQLTGSNNFSGGLTVNGGTLELMSPSSIQSGSALTVGDASSVFGGASFSTIQPADSAPTSIVPEPGTLMLLCCILALFAVFSGKRSIVP